MNAHEAWLGGRRRLVTTLGLAGGFALLALLVCPLIGSDPLSPRVWFTAPNDSPDMSAYIFWKLRLPRVLMASMAGAVLAVSGASFQALLRNPLATPYTLGIASGASLGATLAMYLGVATMLPAGLGLSLAAFSGACLSILVVYGLSRTSRGLPGSVLVLAGVTLSFFLGALVLFVQLLFNPMQLVRMIRWTIGGLEVSGYLPALRVAPFAVLAFLIIARRAGDLNLLAAGEDLARSRGVNAARTRLIVFLAASLSTGVLVAETGPIGFVGLIVPHVLRLLCGSDHRVLVPASALAGAGFLTVCDTVARVGSGGFDMPVGVLTALLGGPFFLVLLCRRRPDALGD